jgi:hypothetical protein
MIKDKSLGAGVLLIPSSVAFVNGQMCRSCICTFRPANGTPRPAELANKKEIIMTKLRADNTVKTEWISHLLQEI